MNLCSEGHDEVCYEGRTCPACDKDEIIDKLKDQVDELIEENRSLQETIDNYDVPDQSDGQDGAKQLHH